MSRSRLVAATLATLVACGALEGGVLYARRVEDRYVRSLAPLPFEYREHATALQAADLRQPDLLLFYGSSELTIPNPFHASEVFRAYPTGFTVFPVGQGGTTSLIMLQQLAALGSAVRDKRVVISLSPPWFYSRLMASPDFYGANFSRLQAYALVFSRALGFEVRQGAARRMLQYPRTLTADPFLTLALQTLADGSAAGRVLYCALWPLGKLQEQVMRLQDHWETVGLIRGQRGLPRRVARVPGALDWSALLGDTERILEEQAATSSGRLRGIFSPYRLQQSAEWADLEHLLEGMRELGARPLVMSMPIAGMFYDAVGISREVRTTLYYDRLRQLAQRHGFPVIDFQDQDEQPGFLDGVGGHLSPKGWVYYARALDGFYHGTLD